MVKNTVDLIVLAAENKLGQDIQIIDIDPKAGICEQFVVITGRNVNHTQAIADEIEDKLLQDGVSPLSVEGHREGRWILLDYDGVIVHVFTADQRSYYNLEGLWSR